MKPCYLFLFLSVLHKSKIKKDLRLGKLRVKDGHLYSNYDQIKSKGESVETTNIERIKKSIIFKIYSF